jgi:AraC-like DNA-binding protein
MGVFEHLRCLRLERARLALERGEVAIAEAAFLAGYASPANFATAFKRRFGLTPTDVRRH